LETFDNIEEIERIDEGFIVEEEDNNIDKLLDEFDDVRKDMKKMIETVESMVEDAKDIFKNTKFDFKSKFLLQERVKAITELFKLLLDIRKEIVKTTKDEILLRRGNIGDSDDVSERDIASIARKVEKFNKKIIEMEKKEEGEK